METPTSDYETHTRRNEGGKRRKTAVLLKIFLDVLSPLIANPGSRAVVVWLAGPFLLAALPAFAQGSPPSEARVEFFSPQGIIEGARQVAARFSEPMVAFGDPRGPEPFSITCPASGRGRWVDPKSWAYDFDNHLPGSIECRFVLKPDLKTLAGQVLGGQTTFTFNTGGPRIVRVFPGARAAIDERQIFILTLDAEAVAETIRGHVRCLVEGETEPRAIELLTGQRRTEVLEFVEKPDSPTTVVMRCQRALPAGAAVTLSWDAGVGAVSGIATDREQRLSFTVRPPFAARVECQDATDDDLLLNRRSSQATHNCHPGGSVWVVFNAPITVEQAATLRLRGSGQERAPALVRQNEVTWIPEIRFDGPFPEQSVWTVAMPPDLRDDAGRSLADARERSWGATIGQAPRSPSVVDSPPVVKLPGAAIVESRIGGMLPVVLHDVDREIHGRWLAIDTASDAATGQRLDPERQEQAILRWLRRIRQKTHTESLLDEQASIHRFTVAKPSGRLETAGIPLPRPGFYLVELENPHFVERENPGFGTQPSNAQDRYLTTTALVTNLGVQFKIGNEGPSLVWVTTLDDARPVAGAAVTIRDACNGERLWGGPTDRDGIARIADLPPASSDASCAVQGLSIGARTDDDWSFTQVADRQYARSTPDSLAHTVLDRTLFRAGETVSMKHLLRRPVLAGFAIPQSNQPRTLTIAHLGSDRSHALPLRWDRHGIAESAWTIPEDAPLGRYAVRMDDLHLENNEFEVAEFRVPAMTARLQLPEAPLVSGGEAGIGVAIDYFAGGPAAYWPILLRTALGERSSPSVPKDYADYRFDEGSDPEEDAAHRLCGADGDGDAMPSFPSVSNGQGEAQVRLAKLPEVCEPRDLVVELDYPDPSGERLSMAQTLTLWPAHIRLGVKTEPWKDGDPLRFTVVALDLAGQPVAGQPVAVELFQRNRAARREYLGNGLYRDRRKAGIERLGEICAGRTDPRGLLQCESRLDQVRDSTGLETLFLRAHARDDRNNVAVSSAGLAPALRRAESWWDNLDLRELEQNAVTPFAMAIVEKIRRMIWFQTGSSFDDGARLEMKPDQPEYEPGETARLRLRLPFSEATALVTVEREGVMEYFVTRWSEATPTLALPIQNHHAPNVFVSVLAVRGRQRDGDPPTWSGDPGKPTFYLAATALQVRSTPYRLNVRVVPERPVYAVRDPVSVKIKVARADGQSLPAGAEVALAAVDEALLNLLPNDSWGLLERMMAARANWVKTVTTLGRVVGQRRYGPVEPAASLFSDRVYAELDERLNRMFSRAMYNGGDGGEGLGSVRERFDTLLLWRGRVKLDPRGEAQVSVPLNDSLSSFRIVAVATAGAGHFGTGQATVRTAQDLTLYAGLPPVVRQGDQFDAVFTARNASPRPLTLAASGRVSGQPGAPALPVLPGQSLTLAPGESREIAWRLTVPFDIETLSWEAAVREPGGKAQDRLRVQQPVTAALPVRTYQATLAQLDRPFALEVERPADALPGRGGVHLALRARLGDGLSGVIEYMTRYPYTCLEQQASVAVALRDRERWEAIAKRLTDYIDHASGLLKYFPSDHLKGDGILTAYILAIAHEAGWPVPEAALAPLTQGLKNFIKGEPPRASGWPAADRTLRQLAALEALSRYDAAVPDLLTGIDLTPEFWPTSTLLDWIGILKRVEGIADREAHLQRAGNQLRARLNLQGTALTFSTEGGDGLWWLMVSADLNAVRAVLALLDEAQWREDLPRLARGAVARQRRGHWDTTLANAWGRLALERFSAAFEAQPVAGRTEARLGERVQARVWRPNAPPAALDFAWPDGRQTLRVDHQGAGRPWALIQSRAAIPLKEPRFAGYALQRTVLPVEQRQPGVWSRGDVARVRLEIDAQADMTWVVVNDPIPAGAAILGTGFGGDSRILTRGEQRESWMQPTFEERRFDGFRAYYEFMPRGQWTVEYTVRFNNAGWFNLPPTRVEALYLPEMFGEWPNALLEVAAGE